MRNVVEPDYKLALILWWAQLWRALPLAIAGGFVTGFIVGFIWAFAGLPKEAMKLPFTILGMIPGIIASVWVLHRMMTKGFGKYRLMIVEK